MATVEALKAKKTSAYFSFCKQHREQTKTRLKDAGKSVSAAALAKALSELWRSLSEEEKQRYKGPSPASNEPPLPSGSVEPEVSEADRACTKKGRVIKGHCDENGDKVCATPSFPSQMEVGLAHSEVEKSCMADATVCTDQVGTCSEDVQGNEKDAGDGLPDSVGLVFPLARVKRIIKLDKDIRVVAADASNLIAQASQLFVGHLASAAYASALKKKHKTIRLEDVKNAVKSEPRIDEFLTEALTDVLHRGEDDDLDSSDGADDASENVNIKGHSSKKSKTSKKPLPEPPAGTRRIADFFSASKQSKVGDSNAE
ncbi:hypothetical protein L7F22_068812 [Adiantum nelumboides]|nr:hypothetical protein [Adiantum nelumboides]